MEEDRTPVREAARNIDAWWNALPEDERPQVVLSGELQEHFGYTAQLIGQAMFSLGWTRRRYEGHHFPRVRYWVRIKAR